jgi:Dyp-type peroxidase family
MNALRLLRAFRATTFTPPKEASVVDAPVLDFDDIQGNVLAGFNKDHQTFLFVRLPDDPAAAKTWVASVVDEVATHTEVASFNALYKQLRARRHQRMDGVLSIIWMNIALTPSGLTKLGHPEPISEKPEAFTQGIAPRAQQLGHTGTSAPANWVPCFQAAGGIDAVLIIAGDDPDDLCEAVLGYIDGIGRHGGSVVLRLEGDARVDDPGHEHFGFKDGVSQPGVRGFTPPGADPNQGDPGQDLLWPGEFVLGYPRQPRPTTPPATQYPPGPEPNIDITQPGEVTPATPDWTKNGSFLVFQRLAQDVARFNDFVSLTSANAGLSEELLGAKLVGRHKSGCPLEIINGLGDVGQLTADVGLTRSDVLEDGHINDFEYQDSDADGHNVPRGAHIRKAYPRDEVPPGELDTQTHRIMRRGIAFGTSFRRGAPIGSPAHAAGERGLLFACYQASIEDQFEFVQTRWVNDPAFPSAGDGVDAILNEADGTSTTIPGASPPQVALQSFITMTGGAYFFAPSISALEAIAAP